MNRCLQLATNGFGNAAPNPMVGCVIVYKNQIIGEGFHQKYGEAHAEVNAINSVKNKEMLKESTLFVNLEPCAHYGKTPPCADLIVKYNIPRVVIGTIDPFAKVAGKGIDILKKAGCDLTVGVLEDECNELNKRFFHFHKTKIPYIILKWAQTNDGFIDKERDADCEAKPNWITNENTRLLVHKWRSEESAIMIGTTTAKNDNPSLNVRDWSGKNPLRIVIDQELSLPKILNIFNQCSNTIIFNNKQNKLVNNLEFIKIDFSRNIIPQILETLHVKNIQSIIIEGGSMLLQSFIDIGCWNEARYFIGESLFKSGVKAPSIAGEFYSQEQIGPDKLIILKNKDSRQCYTS